MMGIRNYLKPRSMKGKLLQFIWKMRLKHNDFVGFLKEVKYHVHHLVMNRVFSV